MTDQQAPAGWYPDDTGRMRWWDGSQWTDRYQDETAVQPTVVEPATPAAPAPQAAVTHTPEPKSRRWLIPTIVGVVALLAGIGIGGAGSNDTKSKAPAVKSSSGLTTADLDTRQSQIDDQAAELKQQQAELGARENKVSAAERKAKANTIDGDGTFTVGDDIKAGRWKNANADDGCYWSINSDANGENIVANSNGGGPQTVDVKNGQFLELSGCGSWKRIG